MAVEGLLTETLVNWKAVGREGSTLYGVLVTFVKQRPAICIHRWQSDGSLRWDGKTGDEEAGGATMAMAGRRHQTRARQPQFVCLDCTYLSTKMKLAILSSPASSINVPSALLFSRSHLELRPLFPTPESMEFSLQDRISRRRRPCLTSSIANSWPLALVSC